MDKSVKLHHKKLGQSIIEVIVGVSVIVLVLGGVVSLMVKTMGAKNKTFDRIKATEFAQVLMEGKVSESKNQQETFWSKVGSSEVGSNVGFTDYSAVISTSKVIDPAASCDVDPPKCAKVVVSVTWQEKATQTISFERFFAKN